MKSKTPTINTSLRFSPRLAPPLVVAALIACCPLADTIVSALANSSATAQTHPTLVSGPSPFAPDCDTSPFAGEINYQNAEVEPWIALDPTNANHLIGVWQQDRWQFGGAHGLMTGVSRDNWNRTFAHFTTCSGGTGANGDVFVTSQEEEGDTSWNGHTERNTHPQSPKDLAKTHRERHSPRER